MKIEIGDFVSKHFNEGDGTFTKWTYKVEEFEKDGDEIIGIRGFGVYTEVGSNCRDSVGEIFCGWDLVDGLVKSTETEKRIWKKSFKKSKLEWRKD